MSELLTSRPEFAKERAECLAFMSIFGITWSMSIYYDRELDCFQYGPTGGNLGIPVGEPIAAP